MANDFCIFCEIVAGRADASVVYEDDHTLAFLDLFPANEGHLLVIPKAHATYLSEMEPDTGQRVFAAAHRLAQAVRECGVRCEGINLFLADGEVAGQEVFHTHLHVIPRFRGDAFRLSPGGKSMAERADLDRTAEMIRGRMG